MRDLPVGNGRLLVNFDDKYHIRDIYFPHVGQENHTAGFPFRFGVWADGQFSWIAGEEWTRELRYLSAAATTNVRLVSEAVQLELTCNDTVPKDLNVFIRKIHVRDLSGRVREVRIFLHHDFRLYENKIGDTAFFDPQTNSIIHYKKHRYFLVNCSPSFDQFATGRKDFQHSEGTWRDAEDGQLDGGSITEGSVDSTVRISCSMVDDQCDLYYWIAAGTNREQVREIDRAVVASGPESLIAASWDRSSPGSGAHSIPDYLSSSVRELYSRSLHIINTQIDRGGAVIAATDHDVTQRATDHYAYLWPRDGAFVVNALDLAGLPEYSRRFFDLCTRIIEKQGYFLQKYNPDGSVGSGWHSSWDPIRNIAVPPIQEDETALVLWAMGEHLATYGSDSLNSDLYDKLVVPAADFLTAFRDSGTSLPLPSWNLWEDRRGVHTFTCCAVASGLRAAAAIADVNGDSARMFAYSTTAEEVVAAMRTHLYSTDLGRFYRSLQPNHDGSLSPDQTIDASLFGIFYLGCFKPDDPIVKSSMAAVETALWNHTAYGGLVRFEMDGYMRGAGGAPSNSWIITTLWLAEYYIATATTIEDLAKALAILEWTALRSNPSGVLPEQIDPLTGEGRSVSPLTWSHSTFVATAQNYIRKYEELSVLKP